MIISLNSPKQNVICWLTMFILASLILFSASKLAMGCIWIVHCHALQYSVPLFTWHTLQCNPLQHRKVNLCVLRKCLITDDYFLTRKVGPFCGNHDRTDKAWLQPFCFFCFCFFLILKINSGSIFFLVGWYQ